MDEKLPSHLTLAQYARLHGKHHATVSIAIKRGRLPATTVLGIWMVESAQPWPKDKRRTGREPGLGRAIR